MTTAGEYTFTSLSSTTTYSTASGGEYAVFLQLQTALSLYNIDEVNINNKVETVDFNAHLADTTKHITISQDRFIFGTDSKGTTFHLTGVNNIIKSGPYYVTTDFTDLPVVSNCYVQHHQSSSADYAMQLCVPVGSDTLYLRRKSATVWQAWKEVFGTNSAKFKKSNGTFTDNDTAQTFTDTFCTVASLVTIAITSATAPQGIWSVESSEGYFTITSTVAESTDITFDYYIQKAV